MRNINGTILLITAVLLSSPLYAAPASDAGMVNLTAPTPRVEFLPESPFERALVAAEPMSRADAEREETGENKWCGCRCTVANYVWSTGYGSTCEAAADNLEDNLWIQADYNCAYGSMDDLCTVFNIQQGTCTWNGSQYQIDGSANYTCLFCYCIPG